VHTLLSEDDIIDVSVNPSDVASLWQFAHATRWDGS